MLAYDTIEGQPGGGLIVLLHGLGDSKLGWQAVVPQFGLTKPTWVFLQAPLEYYGGWSWFAIPGMTDPLDGPEDFERDFTSSRALLAQTIGYIMAEADVSPAETVLCGFSQGCVMTLDHVLQAEHAYAATVALHGWLAHDEAYPDAFGSAWQEQRIFWSHGNYDPLLPCDATAEQAQRMLSLGLNADWRTYDTEHQCCPEEVGDFRQFIIDHLPAGGRP